MHTRSQLIIPQSPPPPPSPQSLPSDFLTTLEEYVKDAPRSVDPGAPTQPRRPGGAADIPPSAMRSSTVMRQGGTTSAVITGQLLLAGKGWA